MNLFDKIISKFSPTPTDYDHLILVLSDIEMGAGGVVDDFPQSDFLAEYLCSYNKRSLKNLKIDLVFNGDTFDFLKTSVNGEYPHHIDESVAMAKFKRVSKMHMAFFEGVRDFIKYAPTLRHAHFIVGNHDSELLFPALQNEIKSLCHFQNNIQFPGFELKIGAVHIEHGSQHDSLFRMDPEKPFIEYHGKQLLNIPWGIVPLLDVVMPHQDKFYHLDRIKPRNQVLELLPEMKEWLTAEFWSYWTKDFIKNFIRSDDPFKKITWPMLKEVIRRFRFLDPDVSVGNHFFHELRNNPHTQIYVLGHMHQPSLWSYGNRKILQSGCFRNEFMMSADGKQLVPINKSAAKIYLKAGHVVRAKLTEIDPPAMPVNYIPMENIHLFKPIINSLLGTKEEREQKLQEIKLEEQKHPTPVDNKAS